MSSVIVNEESDSLMTDKGHNLGITQVRLNVFQCGIKLAPSHESASDFICARKVALKEGDELSREVATWS